MVSANKQGLAVRLSNKQQLVVSHDSSCCLSTLRLHTKCWNLEETIAKKVDFNRRRNDEEVFYGYIIEIYIDFIMFIPEVYEGSRRKTWPSSSL